MAGMYTIKPAAGTKAGSTLTLPPVNDSDKRVVHFNRMQNIITEQEEQSGAWDFTGALPMFTAYAELTLQFTISQAYLLTYPSVGGPYTATFGGLETALLDLSLYVQAGGLCTLTETLASGVTLGFGGASLTSRTAQVKVNGDYQVERLSGAPIAHVTCSFIALDGTWTYMPGSVIVPFS